MQKYNTALLAAVLIMALVSCVKETDVQDVNNVDGTKMKTVTLSPQIVQTKTTLDADHFKLAWSTGDKVSLFNDQDNTNTRIDFIAGGDIVVEVPEETQEVYLSYPFNKDNTSGPGAVDISIAANQIQTNPGQLNGEYYPMVAKGTVGEDNKAMVSFYPVAGALALNIYKSGLDGTEAVSSVTISVSNTGIVGKQTADITGDNIRYESPDKDGPVSVSLTNPLSLSATKPADKRKFDGQIYICLSKQLYSNITFRIHTDKGLYTITSNSFVFDLENNDFSPINIDLAKANYEAVVIPEAVDLGLSVKWASFNLGASKPEEYGDYYAWGETEPYYTQGHAYDRPCNDWREGKTKGYDWPSYSLCDGTESSINKYNTSDGKMTLDPEDDAASVKLGGNWRMPTEAECRELMNNCNWSFARINNVAGMLVTSKVSGYEDASIFLPWAGFRAGLNITNYQKYGYCLSSSRFGDTKSKQLFFNYSTYGAGVSMNINVGTNYRDYGYTIRPVLEIEQESAVVLNKKEITLEEGATSTLSATVVPSSDTQPALIWTSSNTTIATVDHMGVVTAISEGQAIITVATDDGSNVATCSVTVTKSNQYVDLGLPSGLKWAACNLGANSPEDSGTLYAWGETETKASFTSNNYSLSYSISLLTQEYDVATINYGGNWHIPTQTEFNELLSNCTVSDQTVNGVKGLMLTSKTNGNSIFFVGESRYWTSTGVTEAGRTNRASCFYSKVNGGYYYGSYYYRGVFLAEAKEKWNGLLIRPVCY